MRGQAHHNDAEHDRDTGSDTGSVSEQGEARTEPEPLSDAAAAAATDSPTVSVLEGEPTPQKPTPPRRLRSPLSSGDRLQSPLRLAPRLSHDISGGDGDGDGAIETDSLLAGSNGKGGASTGAASRSGNGAAFAADGEVPGYGSGDSVGGYSSVVAAAASSSTAAERLMPPSDGIHEGRGLSRERPGVKLEPSPPPQPPQQQQRVVVAAPPAFARTSPPIDWRSVYVVYFIILVSEGARGLVLPSQWPYLASFGGSKTQLGVLVSSFSFGRVLSTVPLGFLSDTLPMTDVFVVCSLITALGHIGYALAPSITWLIASRVVTGIGSATMSVCRSHISRATPREDRTFHFGYLSGLQFIGFAVLPVMGSVFGILPEFHIGPVRFNEYTYPAWVLVLANVAAVAATVLLYEDPPVGYYRPAEANRSQQRQQEQHGADNVPRYALLVSCLLINVCFRGVVAEVETVVAPNLMQLFGLSLDKTSFYIGALGIVGLAIYFGMKPLSRRFGDFSLVTYGLAATALGAAALAQTRFRLPLPLYLAAVGAVWSFGYPVGQTAVLSLFSKVLAHLPPGGFLGLFSAAGSMARMVFAAMAGWLDGSFGTSAPFQLALAASVVSVVLARALRGKFLHALRS